MEGKQVDSERNQVTFYHFIYFPDPESGVSKGVTIEGSDIVDCSRKFVEAHKAQPFAVYQHLTYQKHEISVN